MTFLVSLLILPDFDAAKARLPARGRQGLDRAARHPLRPGIDGISLWLVLLTTFLMPLTLLSPQAIGIRNIRVREFIVAMLVLEAGMLGAFVALDLFLFYVFWEVMLIPMYLLIGIWGGQRRLYASIKFVIYTMVGSLLMLVAIFYLYVQWHAATGSYSFDYTNLSHLTLPYDAQVLVLRRVRARVRDQGAAVPAAHLVARRARRGADRRLGDPGRRAAQVRHLRLPALRAAAVPAGAPRWGRRCSRSLAVIGIIYGALVAFAQDDVKKLVAYSSVSHLGFCMLGVLALNRAGRAGRASTRCCRTASRPAACSSAIGVLYERRHTRRLAEYGGIWKQMPVFAACS